jgi:hypothetical protein
MNRSEKPLEAKMSNLTDVVGALSRLATRLRKDGDSVDPEQPDDYCVGFRDASHHAAVLVSELMIGPVMTAALLEMDAKAVATADWQCIDQAAAVAFVDKLTKGGLQ